MNKRVMKHGYKVAESLYNFVEHEVLPGTGIDAEDFWLAMANLFNEFTPKNQQLLAIRREFQAKIDAWHLDSSNQGSSNSFNQQKYQQFLTEIGYIVEEKEDFDVDDVEQRLIATQDDPLEEYPLPEKHNMYRRLAISLREHVSQAGAVPWQKFPVDINEIIK